MNPIFKNQYKTGFAKEVELVNFLKTIKETNLEIVDSSEFEDIHQHIDFKIIRTFNIDVKSLRKVSRTDSNTQEDFHYLEILNVKGEKGSIYSPQTTHFIFETFDSWLVVEKEKIQELIKKKVKKIHVKTAKESLYKLYRREKRLDLITTVKTIDLLNISCEIINKF